MSLNTVSDLEEELRGTGEEYTSVDLNSKLQKANDRLVSMVGRYFVERKVIEFEDDTTVDLDFDNLESFDKIHNTNDDSVIDNSEYTVDKTTGTVDFTTSYKDDNFFEGLVLKFYYTPTIFRQLELYIAMRNVLEFQTINTTDGVNNTQTERLNNRIQGMVNDINSRNSTGKQRGDNSNRGSQFPKRLGGN